MNQPSTRREFLRITGLAAAAAHPAIHLCAEDQTIKVYTIQGSVRLLSCTIHELRSI